MVKRVANPAYSCRRINPSTFLIVQADKYHESPFIYAKLFANPSLLVLIDSGCGADATSPATELRDFLEECPVADNDNRPLNAEKRKYLIVSTHCHYDHIGGLEGFTADSVIAASGYQPAFNGGSQRAENSLCAEVGMKVPSYKIDWFLKDGEDLAWEGVKLGLSALHTPGHTPDSLALYDTAERMLFVGDSFYDRRGLLMGGEAYEQSIMFPCQGNWTDFVASVAKLRRFVTKTDAETKDNGSVLRPIRVACGHTTAAAAGADLLSDVQDFFCSVLDGQIPLRKRSLKQGENFGYWIADGEPRFSLIAPERLLEEYHHSRSVMDADRPVPVQSKRSRFDTKQRLTPVDLSASAFVTHADSPLLDWSCQKSPETVYWPRHIGKTKDALGTVANADRPEAQVFAKPSSKETSCANVKDYGLKNIMDADRPFKDRDERRVLQLRPAPDIDHVQYIVKVMSGDKSKTDRVQRSGWKQSGSTETMANGDRPEAKQTYRPVLRALPTQARAERLSSTSVSSLDRPEAKQLHRSSFKAQRSRSVTPEQSLQNAASGDRPEIEHSHRKQRAHSLQYLQHNEGVESVATGDRPDVRSNCANVPTVQLVRSVNREQEYQNAMTSDRPKVQGYQVIVENNHDNLEQGLPNAANGDRPETARKVSPLGQQTRFSDDHELLGRTVHADIPNDHDMDMADELSFEYDAFVESGYAKMPEYLEPELLEKWSRSKLSPMIKSEDNADVSWCWVV